MAIYAGIFISIPWLHIKLILIGVFSIIALLFLIVGLAISCFRNWKRDIGVILITATLAIFFQALCIFCFRATPEYAAIFPREMLSSASNYWLGISCAALLGALGGFLVKKPTLGVKIFS